MSKNAAGWKAFYDANNGAIPVECHAGRAAMGGEAEETHLARIGDEESCACGDPNSKEWKWGDISKMIQFSL